MAILIYIVAFVIAVAFSFVFYFTVIRADASFEALQRKLNQIAQTPDAADATVIIDDAIFSVAVADDREEQLLGLSRIAHIPANTGMLFPQERSARWVFWMKDMEVPLDFVWIDDGKITQINRNVQPPPPLDLIAPGPGLSASMILEIPAGSLDRHSIATSSNVVITFNPIPEDER